jgi:methylamine dehydrogenase accessory protein MauD
LSELAVAVALIPAALAWWGAVGALALLLLFIAGIALSLARGQRPECHCFGQLYSLPAGPATLIRNSLLAGLAGLVVWQGPDGVGSDPLVWFTGLTTTQVVVTALGLAALVAVLAEAWLLYHLLRQNGRLLLRIEALEARLSPTAPHTTAEPLPEAGLPIGRPAPAFRLPNLKGGEITLDGLRAGGKPVLLVFSDPGCGPCSALLPEVARWQKEHAERLRIALISRGTAEANQRKLSEYAVADVLLQHDREVMDAYQAAGTPSALLVDPDGAIGSTLAGGAQAIAELVARTIEGALPNAVRVLAPVRAPSTVPMRENDNGIDRGLARTPVLQIGDAVPPLKLPDLSGQIVNLGDLRGTTTLLLFWNPACGFCARMLGELKTYEANAGKDGPRLLVVSTGTVEANQAMSLNSPVVLDPGMSVGRLFGASGTPMAVLLDAGGNVSSPVVAGAQAVLDLASAGQPIQARAGSST